MGCSKLAIIFATILAAATFADARNTHRGGNHIRRGTFAVDTPTLLTTCETTVLSWNGTRGPYQIGVLVGEQESAPLEHLGNTSSTSYRWKVDVPAFSTITVAVKGATGLIAYSQKVIVSTGVSTTCLTNSTGIGSANSSTNSSSTEGSGIAESDSVPTFSTALPTTGAGNATRGIGAAAATSTSSQSGASHLTARSCLLVSAAILALVA